MTSSGRPLALSWSTPGAAPPKVFKVFKVFQYIENLSKSLQKLASLSDSCLVERQLFLLLVPVTPSVVQHLAPA